MNIGLIGAGKVGFSIGRFFSDGGVRITGYCSRNPDSAREAAAFTNSRYYSSIKDVTADSDAIFITVPDSAIRSVYEQVCTYDIKDKYICHCSGAMSARDAFAGIEETGAHGISIHPLFPVNSKYDSYRELSDAFFCLEGDESAVRIFTEILSGLGAHVQEISSDNKVRYHAGSVFVSNFICALAQVGIDLLTSCGFTPDSARQALAPLMRSNLDHIVRTSPEEALTGPLERADAVTIRHHLEKIDPSQRGLYRELSRELLTIAKKKHPERDYSEIEQILR